MRRSTKLTAFFLSLVLLFSTCSYAVYAENELFSSFNIMNYSNGRYGAVITSRLVYENDNIIRSEIAENTVHIEVLGSDYKHKSSQTIRGELEYICGVYFGKNNNFIVCAQTNPQESDSREVVRVIKYSKSWQRISSASIFGANTYIFADAGSLRFAEYGDYLYIRSCHEMYLSADGKHHQANMTFVVDTVNMTVTDDNYGISNNGTGYVSHSFNQFIATDSTTNSIVAVDHGDAHPRSIVMFRYNNQLGSDTLRNPSNITILGICGNIGDNITNASVSDLIVTPNNYIVAYNSTAQDGITVSRNAYLAIVPKNSFRTESVKTVPLTSYTSADNTVCGTPYITDIGNGKYSVVWEANKSTDTKNNVYYTTVDENGNKLTNVKKTESYLSDCEPVCINGRAVWYSTFSCEPVFYYAGESGAGIASAKYENPENKFPVAKWEKEEYFTDDGEINLIIESTAKIKEIQITTDAGGYSYGSKGKKITVYTGKKPGTYYIYSKLSDGTTVKKEIMVKDASEKTSVPTPPTSDPATTPSAPSAPTTTPPSGNHQYTSKTVKKATCYSEGLIRYECKLCKHTYEETIPALNHTDRDNNSMCDVCTMVILTENPTARIEWEKDEYFTDGSYATFNVICEKGVYITAIYTSASTINFSQNSATSINYYYPSVPAVIKIYVKLSDNQLIKSELVIKDRNAPETTTNAPETTTKAPETTTKAPETTTTPPETTTQQKKIMGDVDNNGKVTPADARFVLRIAARLQIAPDNILEIADTNGDKIITAADARKILRVAARIDSF